MAIMEWNDRLDVRVDSMNDQHQKLIDLMNALHDQFSDGADRATQSKSLDALAAYTVKHFADEERYLESIEYAGIDSHRLIHAELLKEFTAYKDAFDRGGDLTTKFFSFLKLWLTAHIQGIDRKYGPA